MNSSGPIYSSPVSASFIAWLAKRAFVCEESCIGSFEPIRLSLTASFTDVAVDMVGGGSFDNCPQRKLLYGHTQKERETKEREREKKKRKKRPKQECQ